MEPRKSDYVPSKWENIRVNPHDYLYGRYWQYMYSNQAER